MAKVKVLVSFIDRYTDHNHPVGEIFDATDERIAEIQKVDAGLIEIVQEQEADKTDVSEKKTRNGEKGNE